MKKRTKFMDSVCFVLGVFIITTAHEANYLYNYEGEAMLMGVGFALVMWGLLRLYWRRERGNHNR
jgi:hypothetical protein